MNYANILELLLRMRQFCDHPLLLPNYDSATNSFATPHTSSLTVTPNSNSNSNGPAKPQSCESVAAKKERVQRLMCVDLTDDTTVKELPLVPSCSAAVSSVSCSVTPLAVSAESSLSVSVSVPLPLAPPPCAKQKQQKEQQALKQAEEVMK